MTKPKTPWITLADALDRLDAKLSSPGSGGIILRALQEGRVEARGKTVAIPRAGLREVLLHHVEERRHLATDASCKRNAADSILGSLSDDDQWNSVNLCDGFVVVAPEADPDHWIVFFDIELRQPDFERYIDTLLHMPLLDVEGRPRKADEWLSITSALLRLERLGYLNCIDFPDDRALRTKLLELCDDQLDERSIRNDVRALFEIFVRDEPTRRTGGIGLSDFEYDVRAELSSAKSRLFSNRRKT